MQRFNTFFSCFIIYLNRGFLVSSTSISKRQAGNFLTENEAFVIDHSCDFDRDYCAWTNDSSADFNWIRQSGETPSKDTGPPWDHTTLDRNEGSYIFIEASLPRRKGDKARLTSPTLTKPGTFCLTFWHHMHGSDVKDLNVYVKSLSSRKMTTIAHLSGAWSVERNAQVRVLGQDGDWWNEQQSEFVTTSDSQIIIEGVRGENYRGDIAVDDIILSDEPCVEKPIDCDFENNTCGWAQMSKDDFNWLPNRGNTITDMTGPNNDHTTGRSSGRYMYIEASWPRVEGDTARLISPNIECTTDAEPVFQFWYHMYGANIGTLRVYVVASGNFTLQGSLLELNGPQGGIWKMAQILVPPSYYKENKKFQIIIEAERKDYRGDTAIDDVSLIGCHQNTKSRAQTNIPQDMIAPELQSTSESAQTTVDEGRNNETTHQIVTTIPTVKNIQLPENISCNFDIAFDCGWRNESGDFDWVRNRGKTLSVKTGPLFDHTTRVGYYIYAESSIPRRKGDRALFRSPTIEAYTTACVRFYYHMYGDGMGRLELLTAMKGSDRYYLKWVNQGEQSKNETDWRFAEVDVQQAVDYELVFRAIRGSNFKSDIAIDDITVSASPCKMPTPPPTRKATVPQTTLKPTTVTPTRFYQILTTGTTLDCDFDLSTTCSWRQSEIDQFQWTVSTGGSTSSKGTGPSFDHTSGIGEFAFIEASSPRVENDKAILFSPSFRIADIVCVSLWYNMHGNDIGKLAIYKEAHVKSSKKFQLNERELIWERSGSIGNEWKNAQFSLKSRSDIRLVVEATRGKGYRSDIAIDDITVTDDECPTFNCSFDIGRCGWSDDIGNDDFDWTRNSLGTPTMNTGPNYDHTFKNAAGHYLYIESSRPRESGDRARLISPVVMPGSSPKKCLSLWYHSYGKHIGLLNVYKMPLDHVGNYLGSPLWYQTGNEGDQWLFHSINVSDNHPYRIVIEGIRGIDDEGDVAIDDVTISEGECGSCCGSESFRCGNNFCIKDSQTCDHVDDCGDDSDETFCGGCGQVHFHPNTSPLFGKQRVVPTVQLVDSLIAIARSQNRTVYNNALGILSPRRVAEITDEQVDRIKMPDLRQFALKQPNTGIRQENPIIPTKISNELLRVRRESHANDDVTSRDFSEFGQKAVQVPEWMWRSIQDSLKRDRIRDNENGILNRIKRRAAILRITGGDLTRPNSWPWQAAYYVTQTETSVHYFCGGTLIYRYWVITAAHCPQLGDQYHVVLGDHDLMATEGTEQEIKVDLAYTHRAYQLSKDLVADIALVKLKFPAKYTTSVQPACLLKVDDEPFPAGSVCVTTGWGRTSADEDGIELKLRQGEVPIIGNGVCQNDFWSIYRIHDSMVCAGGTGSNSCRGDSGGPLICKRDDRFYLVGITSWGDLRCKPNIPGVYTRVQSYMDWLERIMDSNSCAS